MKPKITVGICVKDSEATIKEAIESLLNQDYPHELMEIIVVDGNSKDKTLEILKACLKNAKIKTKIFQEKGGLGRQRQKVVDNANGEYIVWVDGDMVISKNYISRTVEFMEQYPRVGIVKGRPSLEYKDTLTALEVLSHYVEKNVDYQSKETYSKTLGTGGSVYRTRAIKEVGGFDKSLKYYCEDWDAEIKIKARGWFRTIINNVEYTDYERYGVTWKILWRKYWLRGYHTYQFLRKRPRLVRHYKMFPPAAFLAGLLYAHKLFKTTHKRIVFLLPFQYLFKMTAWYIGFMKSHLNSSK
jgi:glycosyltransferase involved in cell wall biosynthesis